jgi:Tfp pilus assembly protein PilO
VTLTARDRNIMIALVPVLVIVGYWFLVLGPKRQEVSKVDRSLAKQEERRDAAKAAAANAKTAKTDFAADYTEIVRLGKAIPASVDMPSVIVQLNAAAKGTGIRFTKIATGERQVTAATTTPSPTDSSQGGTPAAAGGGSAQSAPGAATESANTAQQTADQRSGAAASSGVAPSDAQTSTSSGGGLPVGGGATAPGASGASTPPAGLETVPLELEFMGNFFNLADFFHRVKRFVRVANQDVVVGGRLLTVEGVRWASDPEIFPRIRAELSATIYLSPKVQGTTAGATPANPAPTTPATPAQSPPAPAATPTATATP